jgi:hypothetical protein
MSQIVNLQRVSMSSKATQLRSGAVGRVRLWLQSRFWGPADSNTWKRHLAPGWYQGESVPRIHHKKPSATTGHASEKDRASPWRQYDSRLPRAEHPQLGKDRTPFGCVEECPPRSFVAPQDHAER